MLFSRSAVSATSTPAKRFSRLSQMYDSGSKKQAVGQTVLLSALAVVLLTLRLDSQVQLKESQEEADRQSTECISCHGTTDSPTMHPTATVRIGCADCHGGHPEVQKPGGAAAGSKAYDDA